MEFNPIHLNILGVNLTSEPRFYLKKLLVFVGNVPKEVSDVLNTIEIKSSEDDFKKLNLKNLDILEKYYGKDYENLLGLNKKSLRLNTTSNITGSDDTDIFSIEDLKPETKNKKTNVPKLNLETDFKFILNFITNVHIYPEDRISEFKDKINLCTHIPIYKQHLFVILDSENTYSQKINSNFEIFENQQVIPMKYKIISDSAVQIDIRRIFDKTINKILDIPIDTNLFQSREYLLVEAWDYFTTIQNVYTTYGVRTYYLIDIDEFVLPQKNLLIDLFQKDIYQLQLLYWGFGVKYWPTMSFDVFKYYIMDEAELNLNYPDLVKANDNKYQEEKKILDEKYELINDSLGKIFVKNEFKKPYYLYPEFKKYHPEFSILSNQKSESIIPVSIKSATLASLAFESVGIHSQVKINVRNLFGKINTSEQIPMVRVKLLVNGKLISLTKLQAPTLIENNINDIQKVYEKVKYRIQMPYYNTILFVVKIPDKLINKTRNDQSYFKQSEAIPNVETNNYLIFNIYDNGKYNVKSVWEEETHMDFQTIYQIIQESINPIINNINNLGRSVFESVKNLNLINSVNTEFTSLTMNLFWKIPMSRNIFEKLDLYIKQNMRAQIIKPSDNATLISGMFQFLMMKGITEYDVKNLERGIATSNYYEYLSNSKIKQNWIKLFEQGRLVIITHRTVDIKIEIQNLKEQEFTNFYQYIISFLFKVEKELLTSDHILEKTKKVDSLSNINKLLKTRDPELYVFKRFGSDVVFSRICQKEHQPIPYLAEEYDLLNDNIKKKTVQYWNYTTKMPMYYYCPNKHFPYLNFLVGQHPKGYCLPCCKKTPPYTYEITKKISTTNENTKENNKKNINKEDTNENTNEEIDNAEYSKKEHIYNVCMQHHLYTESDAKSNPSRYIMNYGKNIDIGRIGKLPDLLDRYLMYNLENVEILDTEDQIITLTINNEKKDYSVKALWKITKNNEIFEEPLKKYVHFLKSNAWSGISENFNAIQIIENSTLSPEHYNRISNVNLNYPILVYKLTETIDVVLDGIHRIAKLYLDAQQNNISIDDAIIKVQYVSIRELHKSEIRTKININKEDKTNEPNFNTITKSNIFLNKEPVKTFDIPVVKRRLMYEKDFIRKHKIGDAEIELKNINNRKKNINKPQKNKDAEPSKISKDMEDFEDNKESIRKPSYFLYGVPQNNANVSNIGAGYAISSALNITFQDFIQKTINFLKNNHNINYFKILFHGMLSRYFPNQDILIAVMIRLFLDDTLTFDNLVSINRFYFWNELFIDIAKNCFNKYVIILDDTSVDTTGTSIKISKIMENIHIILPEKITEVSDIIPEYLDSDALKTNQELDDQSYSKEYILILRKRKKSKTFFSSNKIYYPIFIFIPQIFFKSLNIEKKIFIYSDEIIKLIRQLIVSSLEENVNKIYQESNDFINLNILAQFINHCQHNKIDCSVQTLYVNSKNIYYAVLLNVDKVIYYLPIRFTYFNNLKDNYFADPNHKTSHKPFSRKINEFSDYKQFKEFIELYNEFVIKYSEEQNLYKIIETKNKFGNMLNKRENSIMPAYPLIKIESFLFLTEEKKIIGVQCSYNNSYTYYYFKDVLVTKDNLKKIYETFTHNYNCLTKELSFDVFGEYIKYLRYDPDFVNNLIWKFNENNVSLEQKVPDLVKFYEAIYHKHLYKIFLLEIMANLDHERNENIRSQLIEIIHSTQLKNIKNDFYEKIESLITDPDDLKKIKILIQTYLTVHFDKKILIQDLTKMSYQFDKITLLKLGKISEDFYKNDSKTQLEQMEKMRNIIKHKCKEIIYEGEPDFTNKTISNIFVPCESELESEAYCHKNKLIMSAKNLEDLIDIFISDIVNPIKRSYILSSILINDIQSYFQFEKKKDEEIYLKYF